MSSQHLFFFQPSGAPLPAITGVSAIQEAADQLAATGVLGGPGIAVGVITEAPDTALGTGKVPVTGAGATLVTPGRIRREKEEKKPPRIETRDSPRLRQLREENKKLAAERLRLEQIQEQMRVLADDAEMQQMLAREAAKAAGEFNRVAKEYISLDRQNKMMAMLLAMLME